MKRHARKKLSAVGAMPPNPLSLKTGGGWGGGVAYKVQARRSPWDYKPHPEGVEGIGVYDLVDSGAP